MRSSSWPSLALSGLACLAAADHVVAAEPEYTYDVLTSPGQSSIDYATISPRGVVTGMVESTAEIAHAAFKAVPGHFQVIRVLGADNSAGTSMNGAGDLVGYTFGIGYGGAFIKPNREAAQLLSPPGTNFDELAYGINASRTVVGQYAHTIFDFFLPFKWQDGVWTILPTLDGGSGGFAGAVNDAGIIAGAVYTAGYSSSFAARWDAEGLTLLPTPPGATSSAAFSISSNGIIGGSSTDGTQSHGIVWLGGRYTLLPDFSSSGGGRVNGVNSDGVAVGYSLNPPDLGQSGAIWRHGRISDLSRLVELPAGWRIETAVGINDRGQIVCSGLDASDQRVWMILKPIRASGD